jgi:hypothetical protein
MTVAGRLEEVDPADLYGLREALGSSDRPDYVIKHLGDLLPREDECRGAAQTPDERGL